MATQQGTSRDREEAHEREYRAARTGLADLDEGLAAYQHGMLNLQETAFEIATQLHVADDPQFLQTFQRVADETEENVRRARSEIEQQDEHLHDLQRKHEQELADPELSKPTTR